MSEKLIICSDLKGNSNGVVKMGVTLAKKLGKEAHLVHSYYAPAYYPTLLGDYFGSNYIHDEYEKHMITSLNDQLQNQIHQVEGDKDRTIDESKVLLGDKEDTILDYIEKENPSMVVVGQSEKNFIESFFQGKLAYGLMSGSALPLFIHKGNGNQDIKNILVPIAFDDSDIELDYPIRMANAFGAKVKLVHILNSNLNEEFVKHELFELQDLSSVDMILEKKSLWAKGKFEELRKPLEEAGVEHTTEVIIETKLGEGKALLNEEKRFKPDLIIMGSHARSGFDKFIVGSVANSLIQHSESSILCVPHKEN